MQLRPIEDAIRAWVKTASGLSDAQIYFANQNGAQPANLPFITILISESMRTLGAYDEQEQITDLTQPNGQEITQIVTGQRDLLVSIQAFATGTVTGENTSFSFPVPTGFGAVTATEILTRVQTALGLETIRFNLNAANLAPYDLGTIRRVDAVIETFYEGRAVLDVRFYSTDQALAQTGYIKEVQGVGTFVEGGVPDRNVPFDVIGS